MEAFLPVSREELKTIESFRAGSRRIAAGGSIIDEHRPSAELFTLHADWAFRYKTLCRLQNLGLYKLDGGWLRILEPRALETLGDYFERPMRPAPLI